MARAKRWTDEELRQAVKSAASWGDVVVGIGRVDESKARRYVQAHAVRLGLEVSHLPSFRPVAPVGAHDLPPLRDLAGVVRESRSWAEVMRKCGLRGGSMPVVLKRRAEEEGIDFSHFRGQGWSAAPLAAVPGPFSRAPEAKYVHRAATALASAWFLGRGYMVSWPAEPALYDLIAESDRGLVRVQVKSTRSRDKKGQWIAGISRQVYDAAVRSANGARSRHPYSAEDLDFFFVVTASNEMYLLPVAVVAGRSTLTLDRKYAAFKVA